MAENATTQTIDAVTEGTGSTSEELKADPCRKCDPCVKGDTKCPCKLDPKRDCYCSNCKADCGCPTTPKTLPPIPKPDKCHSKCNCPNHGSGTTPVCLDEIVAQQAGNAGATERDHLKSELTKIVETTKKARQAYTREKYDELVKRWKFQDGEIVKLLHKFKCSVCCWSCVIECHINPLLNELNRAEYALNNSGKLIGEINDLFDKQYFITRFIKHKTRTRDRILNVIKAWDAPAASLEKTLNENEKLMADISKQLGLQPGKVIYDLFLLLIPRHLAIAPWLMITKISTEFKDVFEELYAEDKKRCNPGGGVKDECCEGVNTGQLGFLDRLVSPRAYLIDPDKYFDLICCLIKTRYEPMANIVIEANIELEKVNSDIERNQKIVGPTWPAEFEKNVRAAIPSEVDCDKYPRSEPAEDPCKPVVTPPVVIPPVVTPPKGDYGDDDKKQTAEYVREEADGDADKD